MWWEMVAQTEKGRLKLIRNNELLCIPADSSSIDPNSEAGKQIAARRERVKELNRRMLIIENGLKN